MLAAIRQQNSLTALFGRLPGGKAKPVVSSNRHDRLVSKRQSKGVPVCAFAAFGLSDGEFQDAAQRAVIKNGFGFLVWIGIFRTSITDRLLGKNVVYRLLTKSVVYRLLLRNKFAIYRLLLINNSLI